MMSFILLITFLVIIYAKLNDDNLVKVDLYMESMCPACKEYSETNVLDALQKVGTIMNFQLYPYGNAQTSFNETTGLYTYTCQHGEAECAGNMYLACAIAHNNRADVTTNIPIWVDFYHCLEGVDDPSDLANVKSCASSGSINLNQLMTCAGPGPSQGNPDDGMLLMNKIAIATDDLKPPHEYVPWLVINDQHVSEDDFESKTLIQLVCEQYQGSSKVCAEIK